MKATSISEPFEDLSLNHKYAYRVENLANVGSENTGQGPPRTVYVKVPKRNTMTGMTMRGCLAAQSRMIWA